MGKTAAGRSFHNDQCGQKMCFLCNTLCGLLHNQPQKDMLCEKFEYYVKICDYREPSPLSRENTSHYSTDRTMKHKPRCSNESIELDTLLSLISGVS